MRESARCHDQAQERTEALLCRQRLSDRALFGLHLDFNFFFDPLVLDIFFAGLVAGVLTLGSFFFRCFLVWFWGL